MIEATIMWENQHLKHCKQNTFFCLLFVKALWEDLLQRPTFFFLNVIYLPNISVLRHVCKPPKSVCLCI